MVRERDGDGQDRAEEGELDRRARDEVGPAQGEVAREKPVRFGRGNPPCLPARNVVTCGFDHAAVRAADLRVLEVQRAEDGRKRRKETGHGREVGDLREGGRLPVQSGPFVGMRARAGTDQNKRTLCIASPRIEVLRGRVLEGEHVSLHLTPTSNRNRTAPFLGRTTRSRRVRRLNCCHCLASGGWVSGPRNPLRCLRDRLQTDTGSSKCRRSRQGHRCRCW